MIHNKSGVGSHLTAVDLNGDGLVDIVTSTNRGTFIFWGSAGDSAIGSGAFPIAPQAAARGCQTRAKQKQRGHQDAHGVTPVNRLAIESHVSGSRYPAMIRP